MAYGLVQSACYDGALPRNMRVLQDSQSGEFLVERIDAILWAVALGGDLVEPIVDRRVTTPQEVT